MNSETIPQLPHVMPEIKYVPAVSIILSLYPPATKSQTQHRLQLILENTEVHLLSLYRVEEVLPIIMKLKNIIQKLDYKVRKKGIAIFVSAVAGEIYYLDGEVEEKVSIDEFFEVKGEIFKKQNTRCEVMTA